MFRNILLPVDLTDRHEPALKIAAELAKTGGQVTLFHAIELLQGASREEEAPFYRRLEIRAREHLQQLSEKLKKEQVQSRIVLVYGDRAAEIVRHAGEMAADVIVITSHRVDFQSPGLSWGTLSYKVGILAQCPVLLVK